MVDMDKLSCLAQLRRSMMSNPLYKARLEQSRYESYKKALDIPLNRDYIPQCYFQLVQVPEDFYPLYEFKATDSFALSVLGENRWYEIKENDKNRLLNYVSIAISTVAAIASVIAVLH